MERTSQKGIDSVLRIQRRGCTPLQHPNGVALFGCGREGTLSDLVAGTCDYSVLFVSMVSFAIHFHCVQKESSIEKSCVQLPEISAGLAC